MAFNINEFIQNMSMDGARPNLFEIIFTEAGDNFTFRARASALPASTINQCNTFYFGRMVKFAGTRSFADWTVQVLVDESDFLNPNGPRTKLELWANKLNSHVGNLRSEDSVSVVDYQRDALIRQFSKTGDVIGTYEMKHCFPVDIGAMPLDWGNNNTISEFSVTFAMQYWTRTGVTT